MSTERTLKRHLRRDLGLRSAKGRRKRGPSRAQVDQALNTVLAVLRTRTVPIKREV